MDLFQKEKSKKDQLRDWILSRFVTSTAEVDEWGLKNHHIRARRDAQDLCEEGVIRRITDQEKKRHLSNPQTPMGYWVKNEKT